MPHIWPYNYIIQEICENAESFYADQAGWWIEYTTGKVEDWLGPYDSKKGAIEEAERIIWIHEK